jgi:hypothetical protein
MRRFMRRDGNEQEVIDALEAKGAYVLKIAQVGAPDLIVFFRGRSWLMEVKQPKGGFKPAQIRFRETWKGPEIHTVRSAVEAAALLEGL